MSSKKGTDRLDDFDEVATGHGIPATYQDLQGTVQNVPTATRALMLRALGKVSREAVNLSPPRMELDETTKCYLPTFLEKEKVWGISLQLYELTSARSWGLGDFEDLKTACEIAAAAGADFIGLSPVHALFLSQPNRCSPYSPSNRKFLNPLYIAVDTLPGYEEAWVDQDALATLRETEFVDYEGVTRLKLPVLRKVWQASVDAAEATAGRETFERFRSDAGEELRLHALFEALSLAMVERGHGGGWTDWPAEFQSKDSDTVKRFADDHADEVEFHCWLQWVAAEQLQEAEHCARSTGMRIGLYFDLAVGEAPDGSSSWSTPELVLQGLRVGAPPDVFSTSGQDWGLVALSPTALKAEAMRPYAELLDASMRFAGALRIDHAMGLWQLFLLPEGETPAVGGYLRYPFQDMVATLAAESHRRGTIVIGEDLGNVPDGFRDMMVKAQILGYRVLYFEPVEEVVGSPAVSHLSLACLSTHDLPPLIGWWRGDDIRLARQFGLTGESGAEASLRERQERRTAFIRAIQEAGLSSAAVGSISEPAGAISEELFVAMHRLLARSPSITVALRLADLVGEDRQTNVPGTSDAYPNWRLKLRLPLEEIAGSSLFQCVVAAVTAERPRQS
ncbi:4-alpha-glucanotransferase [Pseudorhizobium banfieldiae]|uniref:4-alpha-glucanotransferase n=1 Tax=Pseudorhizobium banfieldiae TaxID=1125847 RepID=L0NAH3_9HYPH|nr:4-alpha-glucanotransferase [Pseudorhizobium banfieldiae]CAD6599830.1 4-alpha-glucanotransferase [arsenite-oxidising bacterium NT-25]CCF18023.1 4-alpha-glucanotransferase [Pseudorhizobium banfieldiae]